ncbi:unnamed protein product, partial [Polarella glacialis]
IYRAPFRLAAGLLLALVVSPVCFVPTGTPSPSATTPSSSLRFVDRELTPLTAEFGDSAAAGTTSLQAAFASVLAGLCLGLAAAAAPAFAQAVGATAGGGQSVPQFGMVATPMSAEEKAKKLAPSKAQRLAASKVRAQEELARLQGAGGSLKGVLGK